jgi:phosphatidate phosphatase LPIN
MGPMLMSPDRLVTSLKREVVYKKPQLFKIAALRNVRNLFPADEQCFYSGFGNRDTDAISYRAVGINLGKIFIINKSSEIHHFNSMYKKSYPLLNEIVDEMFPSVPSAEYLF